MLTDPALPEKMISALLHDHHGLSVAQVTFLPIGADINSVVYRVETTAGASYFLKLRRGEFAEVAAATPAFLHAQGIKEVMAPIVTRTGELWVWAEGFDWLLYPFMTGRNGYERALSDAHWVHLGQSLRAVHSAVLPTKLVEMLPQEMYSPCWRDFVRTTDETVGTLRYADLIAQELAQFWLTKRDEIRHLVDRAEQLAEASKTRQLPYVLCHSDLHAGNVLLGTDGEIAIVDWDNPILAPKERDLMFAGGGQFGLDRSEAEEEALFYQGYGPVAVDPVALAYYRYERIVADIAAYAAQIFGLLGSAEDRRQGFQQLASQFQPNGVIAVTHRADASNLTN